MSENNIVLSSKKPHTKNTLVEDFMKLGIKKGDLLFVHSSLSSIGWVVGKHITVIQALQETVGEEGTICMPAYSTDFTDPFYWQNPPIPEEWHQVYRENLPAFDPLFTPSRGLGVTAESFRQFPGVLRSNHPTISVTAWGKHAEKIISEHSLDIPFGKRTPFEMMYKLDAKVLFIGTDYETNSSFHLAEALSGVIPTIKQGSRIFVDRVSTWVEYQDIDSNVCDYFTKIGETFEKEYDVQKGLIGQAKSRLFSQREIVDYTVSWIQNNVDLIQSEKSK